MERKPPGEGGEHRSSDSARPVGRPVGPFDLLRLLESRRRKRTGRLAREMTAAGMAEPERPAGRFQIHGEIKHKIMQNHESGWKTS